MGLVGFQVYSGTCLEAQNLSKAFHLVWFRFGFSVLVFSSKSIIHIKTMRRWGSNNKRWWLDKIMRQKTKSVEHCVCGWMSFLKRDRITVDVESISKESMMSMDVIALTTNTITLFHLYIVSCIGVIHSKRIISVMNFDKKGRRRRRSNYN